MQNKAKSTLIVNLFAGPGCGKCLARDTSVLMYDGSIKMSQDVSVGDFLMGRDGKPRRVLKLFTGVDHMYQINPIKGDAFGVTQDHKLVLDYTKHGSKELILSVKEILEFTKGKQARLKLKRANLIEFELSKVGLNPYFLGIWLGDGHSANQRITNCEQEVVDFLNQYGESLGLSTKIYAERGLVNCCEKSREIY